MKKIIYCLFALLGVTTTMRAQHIAIKTNTLSWLTLTPEIGAEIRLAPKVTADISCMYRAWTLREDNKKIMGILVQPELRYWFCQPYYRHFVGLHASYSDYNVGLSKYRYQGFLAGAGLTYGYQIILSQRFNMEFSLGVGYLRLNHDKYNRPTCGLFLNHEKLNYFGPTKAAIRLVYLLP